ncbi:interleukin-10 receptor subunit beta-like isoform X1 [Hypomesus transpacificus]|uniref:interleukin-10 receptor subunit beta-like isoform X1 n=1 Tax=Hypomesus transpacificus TaxID=137520 RepID=UPI001F0774FA|nr:interleukin-10 receptor subunit beta-like isoform X1 [Hypomesus transpacificus]
MKAAFCIPIVLLFFMDGGVLAELPPPINVRIDSINMELVLQWDAALNTTDNITYTAEYRGFYPPYKVMCGNITELRCDFSSVLQPFGVYSFRVRAELQGEGSPWVEISNFVMDEHTEIGPPSVILNASGINIEVTIMDPVFRIKTFRDVYTMASYNITYWEKDHKDKAVHMSDIEQPRMVLPDLESWTSYCVQAQVKTLRLNKLSQPSGVVCETTRKVPVGASRPFRVHGRADQPPSTGSLPPCPCHGGGPSVRAPTDGYRTYRHRPRRDDGGGDGERRVGWVKGGEGSDIGPEKGTCCLHEACSGGCLKVWDPHDNYGVSTVFGFDDVWRISASIAEMSMSFEIR